MAISGSGVAGSGVTEDPTGAAGGGGGAAAVTTAVVTIPAANVSADLTAFPLVIRGTDLPQGWWASATNNATICVETSAGAALVNEVSYVDVTTQELRLLCKVDLSSSVDTVLHVRNDKAPPSTGTVFDDYEYVLHFIGLTGVDGSTPNQDGTVAAPTIIHSETAFTSVLCDSEGMAKSQLVESYVDTGTLLTSIIHLAVSAEYYYKSNSSYDRLIGIYNTDSKYEYLYLYDGQPRINDNIDFASQNHTVSTYIGIPFGMSYQRDGSQPERYSVVATAEQALDTVADTTTMTTTVDITRLSIGSSPDLGTTLNGVGKFYEFRFSSVSRTRAWLEVEAQNISYKNSLYTVALPA